MKDSDRPWASPLLLVLCLTVPALMVTWAASMPLVRPGLASATVTTSVSTSEIRELQAKVVALEANATLLRDTIDRQERTMTLGLGFVTILLTAVGLILPVITYLTSILPGQKVVEDARRAVEGLEERFDQLTERQRVMQLERAIAKLSDEDPSARSSAIGYLGSAFENLSMPQVAQVAAALPLAMPAYRPQLLNVIAPHDLLLVRQVMIEALRDQPTRGANLPAIVRHCELPGAGPVREALQEWTIANQDDAQSVAIQAMATTTEFFVGLLNDRAWVDRLDPQTRAAIVVTLQNAAAQYGRVDVVRASYLWRSVAETSSPSSSILAASPPA
jgi:hypothetical protein